MFKKSLGDDADAITREDRLKAAQELSKRVGVMAACQAMNVSRATFYRRRETKQTKPKPTPARALSNEERDAVLDKLNSQQFADQSPRQVYAKLLDEGDYLCSVRTMYRILQENQSARERRNQLKHPSYQKPELLANGPNEVWSCDITKLKGPEKWTYYYLYEIAPLERQPVLFWNALRLLGGDMDLDSAFVIEFHPTVLAHAVFLSVVGHKPAVLGVVNVNEVTVFVTNWDVR